MLHWIIELPIIVLLVFLLIFGTFPKRAGKKETILRFDRKGSFKQLKRGPAVAHFAFRNTEVWKGVKRIKHQYRSNDCLHTRLIVTIEADIICEDPYPFISTYGRVWKEAQLSRLFQGYLSINIANARLNEINSGSLEHMVDEALMGFLHDNSNVAFDNLQVDLNPESSWARSFNTKAKAIKMLKGEGYLEHLNKR